MVGSSNLAKRLGRFLLQFYLAQKFRKMLKMPSGVFFCVNRVPTANSGQPLTLANRQCWPTGNFGQPSILANRQIWPTVNFGQALILTNH